MNVYTLPGYRHRGLARRGMEMLIDEARHRGLSSLELSATEQGRPLYEALGFTKKDGLYPYEAQPAIGEFSNNNRICIPQIWFFCCLRLPNHSVRDACEDSPDAAVPVRPEMDVRLPELPARVPRSSEPSRLRSAPGSGGNFWHERPDKPVIPDLRFPGLALWHAPDHPGLQRNYPLGDAINKASPPAVLVVLQRRFQGIGRNRRLLRQLALKRLRHNCVRDFTAGNLSVGFRGCCSVGAGSHLPSATDTSPCSFSAWLEAPAHRG